MSQTGQEDTNVSNMQRAIRWPGLSQNRQVALERGTTQINWYFHGTNSVVLIRRLETCGSQQFCGEEAKETG